MRGGISSVSFCLCWSMLVYAAGTEARRDVLSADQKQRLERIQIVFVDVLALTDQGPRTPGPLLTTVRSRMEELGYHVVTDASQPHDAVLRVKCEQHKVWEGTTRSGGDADLPDSPSRVWKGPACQLEYLLDGKKMGWHKEVRTDFQEARQAASDAGADLGEFALQRLNERLEQYGFPVLLAAEWGQASRLLARLDDPHTPPAPKVRIIAQLGEMFSTEAAPRLVHALQDSDPAIAAAAALALGNIGGSQSVGALSGAVRTGGSSTRAAAVKGLGQIGALHGDFSILPTLLEALKSEDLAVKTEAAWALGKLPDKRSYDAIYALYRSLQSLPSQGAGSEQIAKLKEAVNWSLKQIDTFDQFN